MAITINTEPSTSIVQTGYRPLVYNVTSNNANIRKVSCEVYVNSALKKTLIHDPDYYNGVFTSDDFTFDVSRIVQAYYSYTNPPTSAASVVVINDTPTNEIKSVYCTFNETYLSGGLLVESTVDYTSSTSVVLNNTWHPDNEYASLYDQYQNDTSTKRFLTEFQPEGSAFQNYRKCYAGDFIQLSFLTDKANIRAAVLQYDANQNYLGTSYASSTAITKKRGDLVIDTNQLNTLTRYIRVNLRDVAGTTLYSDYYGFSIEQGQNGTEKTVWFINSFGAWDWFYFSGTGEEGINVNGEMFRKSLSTTYDSSNREVSTLENYIDETGVCFSPPLTITDARALSRIKYSPDVRYYNPTLSRYVTINVTNKNDLSINLEGWGQFIKLEYQKSVHIDSQRG